MYCAVSQFEGEHGVVDRVEDPVFGHAGLGVDAPLEYQIVVAVGGQNFHHDVGDALDVADAANVIATGEDDH